MDTTKYIALNNSYKKTMVYHIGIDAGLFCEYLSMLRAMLFCLDRKIRFTLYSEDANFAGDKGWEDYFLPFCDSNHDAINRRFNRRFPPKLSLEILRWYLKSRLMFSIAHLYYFFTKGKHVYLNDYPRLDDSKVFNIPELEINGNYAHALSRLFEITWNFNSETAKTVSLLRESLSLPEKYLGFQVRGGDKIIEALPIEGSCFVESLLSESPTRFFYVLTDDYSLFERLLEQYPGYTFKTLCGKDECGYVHSAFSSRSVEHRKQSITRLLANMDILGKAEMICASITTNPGVFFSLWKNIPVIYVDYPGDRDEVIKIPSEDRGRISARIQGR